MKTIKGIFFGLGLFALPVLLHAQLTVPSIQPIELLPVVEQSPDSIVAITAEAEGLSQIAPSDLPLFGTYWLVMPNGGMAPLPCAPQDLSQPIYAITDDIFLVDQTGGQVNMSPRRLGGMQAMSAMSSTTMVTAAVDRLGNAVADLIERIQGTQYMQAMAMSLGMNIPMPGGGGDGGNYTNSFVGIQIDTNGLWLEITNVSNGWSYLNLHNATNQVYAILTKTNLLDASWTIENELWPVDTNCQPFTVQNFDRQILFVRAEDWTGVTHGGNTVPDWWLWKYFGTTALSDTNIVSQDHQLVYDYTNGLNPNILEFSIEVTNSFVTSPSVPVSLNVFSGAPSRVAVVVDDANFTTDATWSAYTSSNLIVNLGMTSGWHEVWIGLRGFADDPTNAVWQWKRLNLDYTLPQLTITNPIVASGAATTVSVPVIQLQGYANKQLSRLTFDVSNATGIFTNQTGYLTGRFYDTNLMEFTRNYFQCYDIALATNGVNQITVHATDLAGIATTTNFSFTVDYSGDHTAPVLSVVWPPDATSIVDTNFTLRAQVDDVAATITANIVDGNGNTNTVTAQVARDGTVLAQNLPLGAGANTLTVIATDAAGNSSTNSLTVDQNGVLVTVKPFSGVQLNQSSVHVYGTVSDLTVQLTVNDVAASIYDDGTWEADGVPVSPSGAAVLDVEVSSGSSQNMGAHTSSSRSIRANDLTSGTTNGSKQFVLPQPPTVQVSSYESVLNSSGTYIGWCDGVGPTMTDNGNEHWVAGSGGHLHTYYTTWDGICTDPVFPHTYDEDLSAYATDLPVTWEYAEVAQSSDGYWATLHTRTKVALAPTEPAVTTPAKFYLVGASAMEYSNPSSEAQFPDNWWPDVPLPPEWLQINGQTLINSGITNNDNGSVWGYTVIKAPADAHADVTPTAMQVYENWDYTFDVKALELYPPAVDANRDGNITFDSQDQTSATNYYRFWVNNNHDGYDSSILDYDDMNPSVYGSDANNISISCTRDLEDYTRLWINTQGLTADLQNGNLLLALEWKNVVDGNPGIRIFPAVETNGGSLYLTDEATAQAQTNTLANAPYGQCVIDSYVGQDKVAGSQPFIIPTNFWTNANFSADQPVAHLLFDAVSRGSGQLVVSIYKNDGVTKLAEGPPLYLKLQDVKEMYERWTVGDSDGGTVATTASLSTRLPTGVSTPFQYSSLSPEENNYILFVHGWNLAPWEKDAFAETAFKRLYWQGYKGRFGAFQWPTGYNFSWTSILNDHRNFDNSESNAWASATGLLNKLNDLNGTYPDQVYLMAHSMGNIVAGEALRKAGANQVVNAYIAMQGAISAQSYDSTKPNRTASTNIPPDFYAHYYTNGAPCYFNGTAGAGSYINFYNTNDWALNNLWSVDQDLKPDSGFSYNYSDGHFYDGNGIILLFPIDTYEIFSFCDEAHGFALGKQTDVGGKFSGNQIELNAAPYGFGSLHKDHSGEFNSDSMNRQQFWRSVLQRFDLTP